MLGILIGRPLGCLFKTGLPELSATLLHGLLAAAAGLSARGARAFTGRALGAAPAGTGAYSVYHLYSSSMPDVPPMGMNVPQTANRPKSLMPHPFTLNPLLAFLANLRAMC